MQSTGPHLHYTVTSDQNCAGMDGAVDPCQYSIDGLQCSGGGKVNTVPLQHSWIHEYIKYIVE